MAIVSAKAPNCFTAILAIYSAPTYFQRWDIEVSFRDEMSLPGVGQAQVRHPVSVAAAPALAVAA